MVNGHPKLGNLNRQTRIKPKSVLISRYHRSGMQGITTQKTSLKRRTKCNVERRQTLFKICKLTDIQPCSHAFDSIRQLQIEKITTATFPPLFYLPAIAPVMGVEQRPLDPSTLKIVLG